MKAHSRNRTTANNTVFRKNAGKEYSAVANETEQTFFDWLKASNLTEDDFLKALESEDFNISHSFTAYSASFAFMDGHKLIGLPFVWNSGGAGDLVSYKTDLGLLLFYILGKSISPTARAKIDSFLKTNFKL